MVAKKLRNIKTNKDKTTCIKGELRQEKFSPVQVLKLQNLVKEMMILQSWPIENRPCPAIFRSCRSHSYYSHTDNNIYLSEYSIPALAHELCHSCQPYSDGYISHKEDKTAYLKQPVEIQAYQIERFFSLLTSKNIPWYVFNKKPTRNVRLKINAKIKAFMRFSG